MTHGSRSFSLNAIDCKKIATGMGLALAGCAVTYLAKEVLPNIEQSATSGALITAVASILLNVARKWLAGHGKPYHG